MTDADAEATVFVVDDEPAVLKALTRLLRAAGLQAHAFHCPQSFLDDHDRDVPGCAVVDLAMPGLSGLELQRALAASGCERPLVFLSGCSDVPASVRAMRAGAEDFLTKPVNDTELLDAVHRAIGRDRAARKVRAEHAIIRQRVSTLTQRERQVMAWVVSGRLNKQIAADLGIAEKTVKVHRGRLMEKMEAGTLVDLVHIAERAGIGMTDGLADPAREGDRPSL